MANRRRRRLVSSRFSFSYASVMRLLALISPEQLYSIGYGFPPRMIMIYVSPSAYLHPPRVHANATASTVRFPAHLIT
jgi:hypothetical protein